MCAGTSPNLQGLARSRRGAGLVGLQLLFTALHPTFPSSQFIPMRCSTRVLHPPPCHAHEGRAAGSMSHGSEHSSLYSNRPAQCKDNSVFSTRCSPLPDDLRGRFQQCLVHAPSQVSLLYCACSLGRINATMPTAGSQVLEADSCCWMRFLDHVTNDKCGDGLRADAKRSHSMSDASLPPSILERHSS